MALDWKLVVIKMLFTFLPPDLTRYSSLVNCVPLKALMVESNELYKIKPTNWNPVTIHD